ncbi:hypothetical protein A2397_04190 [Candidatus Amesbacteria bacterium RIFOXYB1_FULL_44_23]|uniref:Dephospho-CoA kinase n=1 Tax=Candidatus Amesbacteria bacterium RIFOXYB1_FULL_44_23 TaxID=1797263 RepID=A0A1F4ZQR4_9BACT|nr:MAG: hypothetical protein A2397_04190 [Candidatus Amesbacteria bacterium RIFOXYB1_FULL_44_23]
MIVLGITGTLGAGKGTVAEYLHDKSFIHLSVSGYLTDLIIADKKVVNRDTMLEKANQMRALFGNDYLIRQLYAQAINTGHDCVIESIRNVGEVEYLKKQSNFILIAVDAPAEIRFARILERKSTKDEVSFEKFLADEAREMNDPDPTKTNLSACVKMADMILINDGSQEDLYKKIDQALMSWRAHDTKAKV